MAEEVVGSITTAVTAVVADRAASKILENFNQQTTAAEKLQRLELLLIKIRSTIEVSEKRAIKSTALIQWRNKLEEAASRGEEVLLAFQKRAADVDEAARQHGDDQQQQQAGRKQQFCACYCSVLHKEGPVGHGPARHHHSFSSDEEVKKLDGAVEALEKESTNIGEFIALLQLEASPGLKRTRACNGKVSHNAAVPAEVDGVSLAEPTESRQLLGQKRARCWSGKFSYNVAVAAEVDGVSLAEPTESRELQELAERLRRAKSRITFYEKGRDIKSLKWLAHWALVLTEARQQGFNVLEAIFLKMMGKCDLETDQLRSFVHTMESLTQDAECFNSLLDLCPRKSRFERIDNKP